MVRRAGMARCRLKTGVKFDQDAAWSANRRGPVAGRQTVIVLFKL